MCRKEEDNRLFVLTMENSNNTNSNNFTKENISNIMLVDRTIKDPAVIKSRFAKFKDVYDPNIMAGLAGLGLLSQVENEEGE